MTIQIVPTLAVPSQTLSVRLSDQPCTVHVYQKSTGLYVDLYVNDVLIVGGVVARAGNRIVRSAYLGFVGDLAFIDLQGAEDPDYIGLGSRWVLAYIDP